MADVYKVWDSQRAAALAMKVLHENLAEDQVFLRRFRREAQNLAKLKHPNIVRFYELDQDGELVFMIMEYVDGVTLSKARSRSQSPFTPGQTLSIIQPICSALHFAHQLGLVHCDIKPANIMIDRTSRVLLTDFGIARVTEGATTATMVGAGTPAYMSPEQVKGDDPTAQTDIYSLGVVMYELLTGGERPFTGEHATITGTIGEKIRWEQRKLAPPSPRIHNPNIPAEVEEVVLRCMAKDRKKRYLSVNNLLEALGKAVGAEPESLPTMVFGREEVRSAVQKPPSRRRKTLQTSPVYYVGAAVAGIGLLLGLMSAGKGGGEDPPYPGNPSPVVITSIVEVEVTAAENPVVKIEPTRAPPTDTPPPTFTPIPSLSVYTERTSSGIFLKVTGGGGKLQQQLGTLPEWRISRGAQ
jgi:serine/threonine-protein kinase